LQGLKSEQGAEAPGPLILITAPTNIAVNHTPACQVLAGDIVLTLSFHVTTIYFCCCRCLLNSQ